MKTTGMTGAFVAAAAVISLAACGGADEKAAAAAEAATVSSAAAASSEAAASSAAAAASESAVLKQRREAAASAAAQRSADAAAAAAAASASEAEARKVPTEYSGSGDDVVDITKPGDAKAVLATITYRGAHNFSVKGVDGDEDLLVNEIGNYSGTTLMDADDGNTTQLQITASGPWTIKLSDLTLAEPLNTGANQGSGDNVLLYRGSRGKAAITNQGEHNFAVIETSSNGGRDLLVNEIGDYSGTVPLSAGPSIIEVQSGGDWTIAVG
jgi:uncharacterized protein (DUF2147 family)